MRIRVIDRIICGLVGLLMLILCAAIIAQAAFKVPVFSIADRYFASAGIMPMIVLILTAIVLFILGVYCFLIIFRHRGKKGMFAVQKMEGGELIISVRVLNTLVMKCIEMHPEIKANYLYIENTKDGLIIIIRGTSAADVSIPLTVDIIQKQIRQYLTSCTGIPIKDIQTEIQSAAAEIQDASFPVEKPKQVSPLMETGNKEDEKKIVDKPSVPEASPFVDNSTSFIPQHDIESVQRAVAEVQQTVIDQPEEKTEVFSSEVVHTQVPVPDGDDEAEDGRPLHQRLFAQTAEPCVIPEPIAVEEKGEAVYDTKEKECQSNQIDPLQVAGVSDKQASVHTGDENKE